MENRKIILGTYVAAAFVTWILFNAMMVYLGTFYQVRQLPGIAVYKQVVPVLMAAAVFLYFFKSATVTTTMDEVVAELKKVTWPSRPDVIRSTTVVLVCIIIASFIIAGFDLIWGQVMTLLLKV